MLLLGVALLLLLAASYSVAGRLTAPPPPEPIAAPTAPEPVVASGVVVPGRQARLAAVEPARVLDVPVVAGDRVRKGDVLARLDDREAQRRVDAAESALAISAAQLDLIEAGPRAPEVAMAEAELAAARARLDLLRAGPTIAGLAQARQAVDTALAQREAAFAEQDRLANAPTDDARQAAESAVESDRALVASAEAALAALDAGNAASLQQAQSQVETLKAQLTASEAAYQNVLTLQGAAIAQRDAAKAVLDANFSPTAADVKAAESAVRDAQAQLSQLEGGTYGTACYSGSGIDANGTACSASKEAAAQALALAELRLTQVRRGGPPAQQAQVTAALASAEAVIKNIATQRASLQAGVVQVRESLRAADAQLTALKRGGLEAQRQTARANLVTASERLVADEARLKQVRSGASFAEQVAAESSMRTAEAALYAAEAQLRQVQAGARPEELRAAAAEVDRAAGRLDLVSAGASSQEREIARLRVQQAQAELGSARQALAALHVIAPFDGMIGDIAVQAGETVLPGQAVVSLGDLDSLQIETTDLDETQVRHVALGQSATVTFDALPNRALPARVARIAPMASSGAGGTNFKLTLRLEQPVSDLRWGMTATVELPPQSTTARGQVD